MKKTVIFYLLIILAKQLNAQEFRGMDMWLDYEGSYEKTFHGNLYLHATDTVQMDSLLINFFYFVHKENHLFLDNDIQLLQFTGAVYTTFFSLHSIYVNDTLYMDGVKLSN